MRVEIPDERLRQALGTISRRVREAGGRALLVGGSVRDAELGRTASDLDIEVYGLPPATLAQLLGESFDVDLVGESFGVLKLRGLPIDVSLPRRESKRGSGHRGFEVHSDPEMTVEEAAERRDFTVNAVAWDPLSGEVLDPYGGLGDLRQGILRHVSDRFPEDPLRVLRAMQLVARFELRVAEETVALCSRIGPEDLPRERVFEEWKKLIVGGVRISLGLRFLHDCGWIRLYPELLALVGCPQDSEWHPEGDVWVHTLHVLDAFATERVDDEREDLVVGLACLCHDLGKPGTTVRREGRIRSPGHDVSGEAPTRAFLARLTESRWLVDEVVVLVREHLKPIQLFKADAGPAAIRRLARRVGRIDRLVRLGRADHQGRPPRPFDGFPAGRWLLEAAGRLEVVDSAPQPLVMGRHLLALGLEPGPRIGRLLEACFEAQLDGEFEDLEGGLAVARRLLVETGAADAG